jgi:hypothetical protein
MCSPFYPRSNQRDDCPLCTEVVYMHAYLCTLPSVYFRAHMHNALLLIYKYTIYMMLHFKCSNNN